MTLPAPKSPGGALEVLPTFSVDQLQIIRRTVAVDLYDAEFDLFVELCRSTRLNPMRRQIFAVVYNKKNPEKRRVVYITAIDGMRAVAARNRDYRPDDQPYEITSAEELKDPKTNPLGIERAVVRCYKQDSGGAWHAVVGVAYWEEFAPLREVWDYNKESGRREPTGEFELDRSGQWATMPRLMLAKCAEAQALRKGWPEDLSALYTDDEMHQAEAKIIEGTATEVIENSEREERMKKLGGSKNLIVSWEQYGPPEYIGVGEFYDRVSKWLSGDGNPQEVPDAATVDWFIHHNRETLRQFWGQEADAAFQLKKQMEEMIEAGQKAAPQPEPEAAE